VYCYDLSVMVARKGGVEPLRFWGLAASRRLAHVVQQQAQRMGGRAFAGRRSQ
jgi:hypothetical protein